MKTAKKPKKTAKSITTGQLNKVIDVFVHPLFKKDERYIWFDGFLHALIEQDSQVSVKKFAQYSLPKLVKRKPAKRKPAKKRTDRKRENGLLGR